MFHSSESIIRSSNLQEIRKHFPNSPFETAQLEELFQSTNYSIKHTIRILEEQLEYFQSNYEAPIKEEGEKICRDMHRGPFTREKKSKTPERPKVYKKDKCIEEKCEVGKISKWIEVSMNEINEISEYEMKYEGVDAVDTNQCSICRCDLYDNVLLLPEHERTKINIQMLKGRTEMNVVQMFKCTNHYFHKQCLQHLYKSTGSAKWIKCPICNILYGIRLGDMPKGTMDVQIDHTMKCQGYPSGTIIITYSFPNGTLPNGTHYTGIYIYIYSFIIGTRRVGYLPYTEEGKEISNLLKISFERKLTFTVGRSVTTGKENTVVWAGIHHKTSLTGGSPYFGYPDPTYLNRVKLELADKGIFGKIDTHTQVKKISKGYPHHISMTPTPFLIYPPGKWAGGKGDIGVTGFHQKKTYPQGGNLHGKKTHHVAKGKPSSYRPSIIKK